MLIKEQDLREDKALGARVKSWVAGLNLSAKSPEVLPFEVDGNCQLMCRPRSGKLAKTPVDFEDNDKLRVSSVILEKKYSPDAGVEIMVIFSPVQSEHVSQFSSLTLTLDEAMNQLKEFTEWVDASVLETDKMRENKAKEIKHEIKLPTVESTRASEVWGAW